jgi:hypothetical protein
MEEAPAVRPVDCEVDDRRRIAALRACRCAIQTELSPPRREVLDALVLADVPIDVLAERLGTTRGALCAEEYESLEDLIASETGERR